MRRTEFWLAPVLMLMSVAWLTTSGAHALIATADPSAATVGIAADATAAEKSVAARKERCRLHPGTCKRGQHKPEPPKPSQTG